MYKSTQLLDLVNQALAALPYDRQPAGLYDPIRYALSLGGKRIRPVLMLMAYNLYRENPEHIMMQALGLETYHNFTLLHDDLMDRADVRRGQPTVHRKWNDNQAILSGDTMLLQAYQRVAQCNPRLLPQVLELFTTTTLEIDEGQLLDIEFETRDDVTEEEYIEMIRLNILCNKKTYMLINAQLRANEAQRSELERWLAATEYDEDEKIQAVTRLYDEIGIPQLARQKIEYYYTLAAQSLAKVNLPEERKRILWQYAQQMLNRQN